MDKNYFERRKSRVNRMLEKAMGPEAARYRIHGFGRRPRTAYGLALPAQRILFVDD